MVNAMIQKKLSEYDRMIAEGLMIIKLNFYPKVDLEGWK